MAVIPRSDFAVKPQRWSVQGGLVAPEWRGFWRQLVIAYPMWEGGGTILRNVASPNNNTDGVEGVPTWLATPFGTGILFDGNDAFTLANFVPPARGTIFFVLRRDATGTSHVRPWGSGDRFECFMGGTDNPNITNDCWQAGGDNTRTADDFITSDQWYKAGVTWDKDSGVAATQKIYIGGEEIQSYDAQNVSNDDPGTATLSIGRRTGSAEIFEGQMACWYMWDRILSPGEQAQLAHDPFGLFRMWRPSSASVIAAVAAARRIFITSS